MIELDHRRFVEKIPIERVRGRRGVAGPTWDDLRVLLSLLERWQPKRCLEIGIHRGHTAALLLEYGPFIESYVGIDRVAGNAPTDAGCLAAADPRVTLLVRGDGTETIPAEEVAALGPFDLIFIDSNHSRKGVEHDTAYVAPMLAPGGVLAWHDCGVPSQFRPGGAIFGVRSALQALEDGQAIYVFNNPMHTSSIAFQSEASQRHGVSYYLCQL